MTQVRFYDSELNPLMQTDRVVSLNITAMYRGIGNVEIHFPGDFGEILSLVDKHKCLICIASGVTGIITGWRTAEDIALFGRTAEWLLTKRFLPPFTLNASPSKVAEYALNQGASDFSDVSLEWDSGSKSEFAFDTLTSVYDIVSKVLDGEDAGISLKADPKTKRFVLRVYKGQDKGVILSVSERTACDVTFTGQRTNMATNSGWFLREMVDMGNWNPYLNHPHLYAEGNPDKFCYWKVICDGSRFGIAFREGQYAYCDTHNGALKVSDSIPQPTWDYIQSPDAKGVARWDGSLEGVLSPQKATEELARLTEKTDADALTTTITFGKDYDLGDSLRIRTDLGEYKNTVVRTVRSVDIFFDTDTSGTAPHFE